MFKKSKYFIVLFAGLVIGGAALQSLLNNNKASEEKQYADHLDAVHSEAVLRIEAGINVYSTVVSSIRSFIENSEHFPTELQLQHFLKDLVSEVSFRDSMVVSWIDTNHIFRYVVTPQRIDPYHLKGMSVSRLRPEFEMKKINKMMHDRHISLFDPINLKEGWAAFPFNFSVRDKNGRMMGYIAPVLNVKYLLDYTYRGSHDSLFVHKFTVNHHTDLTREVVYDHTRIYNPKRDEQYYRNFHIPDEAFISSDLDFYGLKLRLGSAYKRQPHASNRIAYITFTWYGLICLFCMITLALYLKNNRLNFMLRKAYKDIALKNHELEANLSKIQTLFKEIHHRIKNNMQIISSLLTLQSNEQAEPEVARALDESKRRIQTMALVHQKLYGAQDLSSIVVKEYIEELVCSVENTLSANTEIPEKSVDIPPALSFNMDIMVPLGLILNELLTNSYKYAFSGDSTNKLQIGIFPRGDHYELIYADSGPGISHEIDIRNSGTLGLELIHILSMQLEGSVAYENKGMSAFKINFRAADK